MATRIYRIIETTDGKKKTHLVEASNQTRALATITYPRFTVDVPNLKDVIALTKAGVEVIKAGEEKTANETNPVIPEEREDATPAAIGA